MKYRITLTPEAAKDYGNLSAREKAEVRDAINSHLLYGPAQESRSRIKRLRNTEHPQFRLRVGEIRVFYDIIGREVVILGILEKRSTEMWLKKWST